MLPYRSKNTPRIEDYRVRPAARPDWVSGTTRLPCPGEEIFCAAGPGVVMRLGGKTGDGSRLVHIKLSDSRQRPYLAAASNVLLPPEPAGIPEGSGARGVPDSLPSARVEPWIGGSPGTSERPEQQ